MSTGTRPEPEFGRRTLHFFSMLDCSGSMQGTKIAALNTACETAIPAMRDEAAKNPEAQVLVRVITFSDNAQWAVLAADLNDFKPPAQPGKTDRFICIREIGVTFNEFLHIIEPTPKTLLKNDGTVITNVQDHGRGFGGAPLDFGLPADK